MASSKLVPISSFPPRTLLPIQKSTSLQVHMNPLKNPSIFHLRTTQTMGPVVLPKLSPRTTIKQEEEEEEGRESPHHQRYEYPDPFTVAFPSLIFSNILFFSSAYNIQVIVGDNEPEEKLVGRFRREVLRAGILQECKRRRFFECTQEKRKRKHREAAKRNRKRPPTPRITREDKAEGLKKMEDSEDGDNWEFHDVDVPYC